MSKATKIEKPKSKFNDKQRAAAIAGLKRATALIETVGWTQGALEEFDNNWKVCGYCMVGALRKVRASAASEKALALVIVPKNTDSDYEHVIIDFNDSTCRTKVKALNMMKRAVTALETNKL